MKNNLINLTKLLSVICISLMVIFGCSKSGEDLAPEIEEPITSNAHTLLDKNGKIMRGVPMVITQIAQNSGVAFAEDVSSWETLRDVYKMNTVRLYWSDIWKHMRGAKENEYWNVDEALPHIDKCVQNAIATGLNVIINYHVTGENEGFTDYEGIEHPRDYNRHHDIRMDFWTKVAKKYKDNDLVYFELSNEPVFNTAGYKNPTFKNNLLEVYNIVRAEAPQREIILFSFNRTDYDILGVVNEYAADIEWDKTTVAFHAYHDKTTTNLKKLMEKFRVICTEWDYPGDYQYVVPIEGDYLTAQTMERLGISWTDWFNSGATDSFERLNTRLVPDAKEKEYWWGNN